MGTWSLTELMWGEDEYTLLPAAPLPFAEGEKMAPALAECFVLQSEPKLLIRKALSKHLLHACHHASLGEPKKISHSLPDSQFMGGPSVQCPTVVVWVWYVERAVAGMSIRVCLAIPAAL